MTRIEWMSDHGVRFILRIEDGSDTDTDLVPGATPFVTTIDTDDDLFCPVRTQTGIIQVATESVDIQAIVGKDPLSRAVTLVMFAPGSSVEQRVWHGYLQTTAFTQTWDKGPNTIELPVWSALYALGARNPSNDVADLTYINFARFLCDLVKPSDDELPVYRQFIFSSFTEPLTSLQYNFNLLNYATWNAELGQYDVLTYGEILADICRLFGWQVQEHGDALVFLTADTPSDYISMLWNQLDVLANGHTPIYDTITQTAESQAIYGSQHTQTFLQGKRKVTVWGNVNDPGNELFTMDLSKEKQGGHDFTSWGPVGVAGVTIYLTINYDNNAGNIFLTSQSDKNIKEIDAQNQTTTGQGCCIAHERMYSTDLINGGESITSDSGWNDRIIWRFNNLPIGSNILSIYVPKRFFYTALQLGYLTLEGDVEYAQNARDAWNNVEDGAIELRLHVGATTFGPYIVRIHDGKLSGDHTADAFGNQSNGFNIPIPKVEGQVVITMRVPTDSVLNTCGMTRTNYYSLRNFKVSINYQYWLPYDWQIPTRNIEVRDISHGFVDDYESECQLTTRVFQTYTPLRHRGSQALLRWSERGTGIILAPTLTATPPTTLYDGKTPEVALADRLVAYYKQSRKKITAYLRGDIPLAPWLMQKIGARTEQYVVLSQQVDWKRGQIAADLYEVPNDE